MLKIACSTEVGPHQCSEEWDNHLPRLASDAVLDAPQDTDDHFGCQGALLTHIQLAINPNPHISFRRAALKALIPQFVHITRIIPFQLQNLALACIKFHTVANCPALYPDLSVRASLPSRESTAPLNLVSLANLFNIYLVPVFGSFIKILKSTGPKIEPWGTLLVTGRQPDVTAFTVTL